MRDIGDRRKEGHCGDEGSQGCGHWDWGWEMLGNWYRDSLGDTVTGASGTGRAEGC